MRMEEHVGGKTHGLWRADMLVNVFDEQRGHAPNAIRIQHRKINEMRCRCLKIQNQRLFPRRPTGLAVVNITRLSEARSKSDFSLPAAVIATENVNELVFDGGSG